MNKVKLEDFACGQCKKIPKPGDKIYICSGCNSKRYSCEACYLVLQEIAEEKPRKRSWYPMGHNHGSNDSMLKFEPTLTKLFSEYFTPHDGFCSNSKYGCQKEFFPQKVHEKSCIYQVVPCPSFNCKDVISFKDVEDHIEQCHKEIYKSACKEMLKVDKEWNFKGTEIELDEITCCLSSYDQKFFAQVEVREDDLYFKVIMLGHQVNAIPFGINMTFFLEDGKNILMKDRVYPITDVSSARDVGFSKVSLEKLTQYFDTKSMELKCQPKIDFCLKIVNEKMDEIAKDKTENSESGNTSIS